MYDLKRDPLERKNLARRGYKRTPLQQQEYRRLRKKLARVQTTRLRPLGRLDVRLTCPVLRLPAGSGRPL
jgi:hypothetical protein